jgi:hypothetical protein
MKESQLSFRRSNRLLFSEEPEMNKSKSMIKFRMTGIENKINEKLKSIKIVHDKIKEQQEFDLDLPLIKTEVKERINKLLNTPKKEPKPKARGSSKNTEMGQVGTLNIADGEYNVNLIHPKKFISDYLERDIFHKDPADRDEFYDLIAKRLSKSTF